MTKRVFFHVGLPKSGTTYLQAVLRKNKPRLMAQANLLYPGQSWADQVAAVRDLRGMRVPGRQRAGVKGSWDKLAGDIADWEGNSIVSMEWLCAASPQQIRSLESDLAPARVEVIITLRDLGRTLPAAWQEFVQNRQEWPWAEFLKEVASGQLTSGAARAFWAQQDAARLVAIWSQCLSPGQVHVVTAPPSGADPSVLWERFCQVLDLDSTAYETRYVGSNESLGLESAEMMRRLNAVTRLYGVDPTLYRKLFKRRMAKQALSQRKTQESKLAVPSEHHSWVRERASEQIAALESLGVGVVGNTQDLVPNLEQDYTAQPEDLDADALLDAALHGCVAVVTQNEADLRRLRNQLEHADGLRAESADLRRQLTDLQDHVDWVRTQPVRAALGALSNRNRVIDFGRRLYVRARSLLMR